MTGTDAIIERILTSYDTITVVGASRAAFKAAHSVPAHMQRHGWRIIPVNPCGSTRSTWVPDDRRGRVAEMAGVLRAA